MLLEQKKGLCLLYPSPFPTLEGKMGGSERPQPPAQPVSHKQGCRASPGPAHDADRIVLLHVLFDLIKDSKISPRSERPEYSLRNVLGLS